jgi:DNA-binding transcriptional MerR regulator
MPTLGAVLRAHRPRASPPRTPSGYRNYDDEAAARLLFITRAKRICLTLEQIAEVLPIWIGVNCTATPEEIVRLQHVAKQLEEVRVALEDAPPRNACTRSPAVCPEPATPRSPRSPGSRRDGREPTALRRDLTHGSAT